MARTTLYSKDEEQKKATEGTEETTSPNAVVTTDDPSTPTTTTQGGDNTPSTTNTATQATAEPENPYEVRLGQLRAEVEAEEEAYKKQNEEYKRRLEKARAARENHRSVIASIVEDNKPKYDEDRAKKLRNIAIVQSLGDMLSAAARGYFAYRKGGAGVVPNVKTDSPFKPLDEINKMREEYLKRNEEWKDLMAATELKSAEAEEVAAKALQTKAEADYKEAKQNADAKKKLYDEWFKSYLESEEKKEAAELKRINDNEQKELERQTRREIAQANNATREAIKAMGNKSDKSTSFTAEDYALLDEYNKAFPLTKSVKDSEGMTEEKPYTQSDYDKMSKEEKSARLARARVWKISKTTTLGTQSTSTNNSKSEYDEVVANLKTRGFSEEDAKTKALEFLKSKYGDNWGYKSYIMQ